MSEQPAPPRKVYRLKPHDAPPTPPPPAAEPPSTSASEPAISEPSPLAHAPATAPEPGQRIEIRDLIRQGVPQGKLLTISPPVKLPMDDKERNMMLGMCVAGIVGVMMIWQGLTGIITAWEARSWPVTPGIVESVEVITTEGGEDGDTTYEPVVTYSYTVAGSRYVADRVDVRDPVKHQLVSAQDVTRNYRKGNPVSVYYNPKNPASALLEPGASKENWIYAFFGSMLTILGGFAAHALWRAFREDL